MAQEKKKIIIDHTDFTDHNETEIPGAVILTGNVRLLHDGVKINTNKAYYFPKENYAKLYGNVKMNQGDSIFMDSPYAEYNGDKKFAFASGGVILRSPDTKLTTDTIYFDRNIQQAYYNSYGTIVNADNTLKSKSGRFFIPEKKYQFRTAVKLTNPKYVMDTNHMDYYTNSGHTYVFGPTTIKSKDGDYIYTEKGFYDTKKDVAHLLTKSFINHGTRIITGDSLYYNKPKNFSSATNNVRITDTVNKYIAEGHYAEVYKAKDSMFMTKHAVIKTLVEKDTLYSHAKRMVVTGKPGFRIIRGYNDARFYKIDMSGKCDSLHSDEAKGLTQLIRKPVVWNGDSQLTGDVIHLISNNKTEKLDSLKVLNNAFIVQLDTISSNRNPKAPLQFNQVKGVNLYGKFRDNKLYEVDLIKNTEKIYYMYDDDDELIGIDKGVSSKIHLELEDNQINVVQSLINPESQSYPDTEADFPQNARKLKNFVWRGDEQIKKMEDIFPEEEKKIHEDIVSKTAKNKPKVDKPMEPLEETLDYDKNNPKPKPKPQPETKPATTKPAQ